MLCEGKEIEEWIATVIPESQSLRGPFAYNITASISQFSAIGLSPSTNYSLAGERLGNYLYTSFFFNITDPIDSFLSQLELSLDLSLSDKKEIMVFANLDSLALPKKNCHTFSAQYNEDHPTFIINPCNFTSGVWFFTILQNITENLSDPPTLNVVLQATLKDFETHHVVFDRAALPQPNSEKNQIQEQSFQSQISFGQVSDDYLVDIENLELSLDQTQRTFLNITVESLSLGATIDFLVQVGIPPNSKCSSNPTFSFESQSCPTSTQCSIIIKICDFFATNSTYVSISGTSSSSSIPLKYSINFALNIIDPQLVNIVLLDKPLQLHVASNSLQYFWVPTSGYAHNSWVEIACLMSSHDFVSYPTLVVEITAEEHLISEKLTDISICNSKPSHSCVLSSNSTSCIIQLTACQVARQNPWLLRVVSNKVYDIRQVPVQLQTSLQQIRDIPFEQVITRTIHSGQYHHYYFDFQTTGEERTLQIEILDESQEALTVFMEYEKIAGDSCTEPCFSSFSEQTIKPFRHFRFDYCNPSTAATSRIYISVLFENTNNEGDLSQKTLSYKMELTCDLEEVRPSQTISFGDSAQDSLSVSTTNSYSVELGDFAASQDSVVMTLETNSFSTSTELKTSLSTSSSSDLLNCPTTFASCTVNSASSFCSIEIDHCLFNIKDPLAILQVTTNSSVLPVPYTLNLQRRPTEVPTLLFNDHEHFAQTQYSNIKHFQFESTTASALYVQFSIDQLVVANQEKQRVTFYTNRNTLAGPSPCFSSFDSCTTSDTCVIMLDACSVGSKTSFYFSARATNSVSRSVSFSILIQQDTQGVVDLHPSPVLQEYESVSGQRKFFRITVPTSTSTTASVPVLSLLALSGTASAQLEIVDSSNSELSSFCSCFFPDTSFSSSSSTLSYTFLQDCPTIKTAQTKTELNALLIVSVNGVNLIDLVRFQLKLFVETQSIKEISLASPFSQFTSIGDDQLLYFSFKNVQSTDDLIVSITSITNGIVILHFDPIAPFTPVSCPTSSQGTTCSASASACVSVFSPCRESPRVFLSLEGHSSSAGNTTFILEISQKSFGSLVLDSLVSADLRADMPQRMTLTVPDLKQPEALLISMACVDNTCDSLRILLHQDSTCYVPILEKNCTEGPSVCHLLLDPCFFPPGSTYTLSIFPQHQDVVQISLSKVAAIDEGIITTRTSRLIALDSSSSHYLSFSAVSLDQTSRDLLNFTITPTSSDCLFNALLSYGELPGLTDCADQSCSDHSSCFLLIDSCSFRSGTYYLVLWSQTPCSVNVLVDQRTTTFLSTLELNVDYTFKLPPQSLSQMVLQVDSMVSVPKQSPEMLDLISVAIFGSSSSSLQAFYQKNSFAGPKGTSFGDCFSSVEKHNPDYTFRFGVHEPSAQGKHYFGLLNPTDDEISVSISPTTTSSQTIVPSNSTTTLFALDDFESVLLKLDMSSVEIYPFSFVKIDISLETASLSGPRARLSLLDVSEGSISLINGCTASKSCSIRVAICQIGNIDSALAMIDLLSSDKVTVKVSFSIDNPRSYSISPSHTSQKLPVVFDVYGRGSSLAIIDLNSIDLSRLFFMQILFDVEATVSLVVSKYDCFDNNEVELVEMDSSDEICNQFGLYPCYGVRLYNEDITSNKMVLQVSVPVSSPNIINAAIFLSIPEATPLPINKWNLFTTEYYYPTLFRLDVTPEELAFGQSLHVEIETFCTNTVMYVNKDSLPSPSNNINPCNPLKHNCLSWSLPSCLIESGEAHGTFYISVDNIRDGIESETDFLIHTTVADSPLEIIPMESTGLRFVDSTSQHSVWYVPIPSRRETIDFSIEIALSLGEDILELREFHTIPAPIHSRLSVSADTICSEALSTCLLSVHNKFSCSVRLSPCQLRQHSGLYLFVSDPVDDLYLSVEKSNDAIALYSLSSHNTNLRLKESIAQPSQTHFQFQIGDALFEGFRLEMSLTLPTKKGEVDLLVYDDLSLSYCDQSSSAVEKFDFEKYSIKSSSSSCSFVLDFCQVSLSSSLFFTVFSKGSEMVQYQLTASNTVKTTTLSQGEGVCALITSRDMYVWYSLPIHKDDSLMRHRVAIEILDEYYSSSLQIFFSMEGSGAAATANCFDYMTTCNGTLSPCVIDVEDLRMKDQIVSVAIRLDESSKLSMSEFQVEWVIDSGIDRMSLTSIPSVTRFSAPHNFRIPLDIYRAPLSEPSTVLVLIATPMYDWDTEGVSMFSSTEMSVPTESAIGCARLGPNCIQVIGCNKTSPFITFSVHGTYYELVLEYVEIETLSNLEIGKQYQQLSVGSQQFVAFTFSLGPGIGFNNQVRISFGTVENGLLGFWVNEGSVGDWSCALAQQWGISNHYESVITRDKLSSKTFFIIVTGFTSGALSNKFVAFDLMIQKVTPLGFIGPVSNLLKTSTLYPMSYETINTLQFSIVISDLDMKGPLLHLHIKDRLGQRLAIEVLSQTEDQRILEKIQKQESDFEWVFNTEGRKITQLDILVNTPDCLTQESCVFDVEFEVFDISMLDLRSESVLTIGPKSWSFYRVSSLLNTPKLFVIDVRSSRDQSAISMKLFGSDQDLSGPNAIRETLCHQDQSCPMEFTWEADVSQMPSDLLIAVEGSAGSTFKVFWNEGPKVCSNFQDLHSRSDTWCAFLDVIDKKYIPESTKQALQMQELLSDTYENLFEAFSCVPGCSCTQLSLACLRALQVYTCESLFPICDHKTGFQILPCLSSCQAVENYCGKFEDVGLAPLSCLNTFRYSTCSGWSVPSQSNHSDSNNPISSDHSPGGVLSSEGSSEPPVWLIVIVSLLVVLLGVTIVVAVLAWKKGLGADFELSYRSLFARRASEEEENPFDPGFEYEEEDFGDTSYEMLRFESDQESNESDDGNDENESDKVDDDLPALPAADHLV